MLNCGMQGLAYFDIRIWDYNTKIRWIQDFTCERDVRCDQMAMGQQG